MSWLEVRIAARVSGWTARIWRQLRPAPPLAIGDRGIFDRRLGVGWIPWEQIEGAFRASREGDDPDTLFLRVRPTERQWRRLTRGRGPSDWSGPVPTLVDLPVDLAGADVSEVQILQEIVGHAANGPGGSGPGFAGPHGSVA